MWVIARGFGVCILGTSRYALDPNQGSRNVRRNDACSLRADIRNISGPQSLLCMCGIRRDAPIQ